jgi:hypothetical protein
MEFKFKLDAESLPRRVPQLTPQTTVLQHRASYHLLYTEVKHEKGYELQNGSFCSLPTIAHVVLISPRN